MLRVFAAEPGFYRIFIDFSISIKRYWLLFRMYSAMIESRPLTLREPLCVKGDGYFLQHPVLYFAAPVWVRIFFFGGTNMETRIAVVSMIVEQPESVAALNAILHEYGSYIIGRMGIPYRAKERKVNIISVAMDAPQDVTSTMAGRIGKLAGISIKTAYSNVINYDAAAD